MTVPSPTAERMENEWLCRFTFWKAHARAETHAAHLLRSGGVALGHGERDIGYAGAVVGASYAEHVRLDLERERAAQGMDDEVQLELVGYDGRLARMA